ncbi:MAG: hydrogenase maturation protease [Caldiserica bacterium]|nr:hydrogenase maturation protease [Caldisericota bacterium]
MAYGNPYRQDDGIGHYVVQKAEISAQKLFLQELSLDLLEELALCDYAVFVDAALEGEEVRVREIFPENKPSFLSHHLLPEQFLFWLEELYHRRPRAFLLSLRGYNFDFGEGLSPEALASAEKGIKILENLIKEVQEREEENERPQN